VELPAELGGRRYVLGVVARIQRTHRRHVLDGLEVVGDRLDDREDGS
jgi:hypothetical protein